MHSDDIKSGKEIIAQFLASLNTNDGIDAGTLKAIGDLIKSEKLSKTKLLRALEESRESAHEVGESDQAEDSSDV